jgi:hypothetical protein
MPFNEALFWFGLTAFGTGLYFWVEASVKYLYSVGLTAIGALACAYSVYRHYHPEIPAVPLWVVLLLVTWSFLGYTMYFRRLTVRPKGPSKLVIHWANYRAVENSGDVYDVGDFLRQIVSGDSLVCDIENHNFVIGNKNFVPHDPLPFKPKRLQVNYSYGGQPACTTERREHGRLLLPEDSKIQWLMSEIDRLKAAQPKPSQYAPGGLQLKTLELCIELKGFLGEHGTEPAQSADEAATKWRAKFLGAFRQKFRTSVPELRDEILHNAQINDSRLNGCIDTAMHDPNGNVQAVEGIVNRLWEMAKDINC